MRSAHLRMMEVQMAKLPHRCLDKMKANSSVFERLRLLFILCLPIKCRMKKFPTLFVVYRVLTHQQHQSIFRYCIGARQRKRETTLIGNGRQTSIATAARMSIKPNEDLASFFDSGGTDDHAVMGNSTWELSKDSELDTVPELVGNMMPQPHDSSSSSLCRLREQLCGAMAEGRSLTGETTRFLPASELDRLITVEVVQATLLETGASFHNAPHLASLAVTASMKKIFAILAMLSKPSAIEGFIAHGFDDFWLTNTTAATTHRELARILPGIVDEEAAESFLDWKYIINPPLLHLPSNEGGEYECFHERTVLPFTHVEQANSGSYGTIYRVRIHPDHHHGPSFQDPESSSPYFAVKKLIRPDERHFVQELNALQRASQHHHPHIIQLLASFRLGQDFHFVFPWADSSLNMFWRLNPNPEMDAKLSTWVVDQCLGITKGLQLLHSSQPQSSELAVAGLGTRKPDHYGRHGDLKPANILYFPTSMTADEKHLGNLVIADFGFAEFPIPAVRQRRLPATTPVYRPPECDIEPQKVSSAFDIWSLGCIFLELATWVVSGRDGLEKLAVRRQDTLRNDPSRDAFFRYTQNSTGQVEAKLKDEILQVSETSPDQLMLKTDSYLTVDFHP